MLSRFSLPGVGALFSARTVYTPEETNLAIGQIKLLGKRSSGGTDEASLSDIKEILTLMRRYSDSLSVQRVACHALSNLAMQVVSARWIVQKNGVSLILKSIDKFLEDQKLCWLASSAIWNLARPPANRSAIGKQGVMAMLKILYQHRSKEKVTNTAIGALSNLSLRDDLKDIIARKEHLDVILAVLSHSLSNDNFSVLTSGAGLLANIAVSDAHAAELVALSALDIVLPLLQRTREDDTLFRNSCAALNNLVTADGFLDAFLQARGLECVLSFLEKYSESELYSGLLENCLATIDAESGVKTTSLHYACFHGKLKVLKKLLADEEFDIEESDGRNMTCLDYAISNNRLEVVEFLSRLGATHRGQTDNHSQEIEDALANGAAVLKDTRGTTEEAIVETLKHFPTDLCHFMIDFQSNTDMLKAMDRY